MSRANLYVRFADGTMRYGIYHGTCDSALPSLYTHPYIAWDRLNIDNGWLATWHEGEGEPVQVATDYGLGFSWRATATANCLTSNHEPLDNYAYSDGLPDWARYPDPIGDPYALPDRPTDHA